MEKVVRKIDNTNRHKPYGLTAWEPVDDVYIVRYYPRPVYEVDVAIDKLKQFQQLDFTNPQQSVFMDLKLDMKLEKKVMMYQIFYYFLVLQGYLCRR